MHNIVLAIDFDGTMSHANYPTLGDPKPNLSEVFKKLKNEGYYIIIWTCREGVHIEDIANWCIKHDIPYDLINEHHPEILAHYKNNTRKICADIYVDDRCLYKLPDNWLEIYQLIIQRSSELESKCLNEIL